MEGHEVFDVGAVPMALSSMGVYRSALLVLLLAFGCTTALGAEAKRVLMLHSFGRDFKPWREYATTIRTELDRQSPWPLDIQDQSLVTARSDDGDAEVAFIEYLRALYSKHPPDLIVSLGAPAAQFVQRHRPRIFPQAPMLLTAVEQRRIGISALTEYDAAVTTAQNYSVIFENILRVLPETRNITFITGNSPNERFWRDEMNREAKAFGGRVSFTSLSDLPFAEILKQVSELPPHTVIFWRGVQLDGAGGVHEGDAALKRLHAVAKGPIIAVNDVFFTPEITGGLMISVAELSRVAAATGVRILEGEKPASIKVQSIGTTTSKYNWREMQRWGISESTLPPGSEVHFRELSLWQQYRAQMLAIIATLMAQAALIGWLFYEHRRRHIAEVLARNSMAELTHMNRVSTVGEFSASIAHEVNQPLTGIVTRASAGRRWLSGAKPDIEKARAAFDQIEAAGHRAGEIIKNLRSMFKKDHPQDKSLVDINKLVWKVLELVRVDLQKHRIDLEPRFDRRIPPVLGNEVQLQQVILNLITNAIDSMRSARLRVLSISTILTDADRVQVSIEDTGTGIDPANVNQIFKPMFTTKDHGMGMGLSICQSIIENHDGRIRVTPGSKSGAIFHFELPTKAA